MLMKFFRFILLIVLVVSQTNALYDRYADDDQFNSLTSEQLAELDEYLSHKVNEGSTSEILNRNTRYPNQNSFGKRDALWTTTEVLDCIRRVKLYKDSSKLDLVTEMLNCYRRLKHSG